MFKEFQKFILRGNLVELAIGFTVGASFTTVARSLVDDILMPPIAALLGNEDFTDLFVVIKGGEDGSRVFNTLAEAQAAGAITLNYGRFLTNILALLIVAVAMFMVIKLVNKLEHQISGLTKKEQEEGKKDPDQKKCTFCLSTIPYKATRCPNCTSELPSKK